MHDLDARSVNGGTMRLPALLFTFLLTAPPAMAQSYDPTYEPNEVDPYGDPYEASVDAYVDVNVAPVGNDVPDISIFFERLAPFGTWFDDPIYGYVFAPADPSYTPYSNGFWKLTDYGWTWISNDPFGWATDHYGRWLWRSRWVWKPDTTWGPAWVQWRVGENAIGWAPMGYDYDAYIPETYWRFVPTVYITSRDLPRYYVRSDHGRYLRDTRPIVRWNRHGSQRWVAGPDRSYLERHRVRVQRDRYDLREIGRLDRQERLRAEQRVQQTRPQYRDRLRRESEVRPVLERRRVELERRQVQQHRQRQQIDRQRQPDRRIDEQRRLQDNQRLEQQQRRDADRQRLERERGDQRLDQQRRQNELEQQRRDADRQRLERQRGDQRLDQQRRQNEL
jgi:hypothetical protein